MNGKEKIIQRILDDADVKCADLIAAAQSKAAEIDEKAQSKLQSDKDALLAELEMIFNLTVHGISLDR